MKFFVTGATGFIGSYFLKHAYAKGHNLIGLRRSELSKAKLDLPDSLNWVDKAMDELETKDLLGVETFVHLASPGVSPQKATFQELLYWNVTVLGNLLEMATQSGVKRVVIAGTFAEYGKSADRYSHIPPDAPLFPTYDYAASKAAAFEIAHAFAVSRKIELVYLRIFSAYGKGQHPQNFWPSLMDASKKGNDFEMTKGEQVRDYLTVESVAEQFLEWCLRDDVLPGEPVIKNLGTGCPVSMREFAEYWWRKSEAKGALKIGALPYRENEIMRFVPQI